MLSDDQIKDVWKAKFLPKYDLYISVISRVIMPNVSSGLQEFLSFFLSSGAAATLIGNAPKWIPVVFSLVVAVITAYAVAVNLDSKVRTMAKLHYAWNQIGSDYARLWNHVYRDEAESELVDLQRREAEFSELGTTEAPNDPKRLLRWQDQVNRFHRLESV